MHAVIVFGRLLNEQLEKVSKESTSLRVKNARLASQVRFYESSVLDTLWFCNKKCKMQHWQNSFFGQGWSQWSGTRFVEEVSNSLSLLPVWSVVTLINGHWSVVTLINLHLRTAASSVFKCGLLSPFLSYELCPAFRYKTLHCIMHASFYLVIL